MKTGRVKRRYMAGQVGGDHGCTWPLVSHVAGCVQLQLPSRVSGFSNLQNHCKDTNGKGNKTGFTHLKASVDYLVEAKQFPINGTTVKDLKEKQEETEFTINDEQGTHADGHHRHQTILT